MLQRVRRWEHRHPKISALLYLLFVLAIGGVVYKCSADEARLHPYAETPAR